MGSASMAAGAATSRSITRVFFVRGSVPSVVTDTGPLIALFDTNDRDHSNALAWFEAAFVDAVCHSPRPRK